MKKTKLVINNHYPSKYQNQVENIVIVECVVNLMLIIWMFKILNYIIAYQITRSCKLF